jgi:hypothetical protein
MHQKFSRLKNSFSSYSNSEQVKLLKLVLAQFSTSAAAVISVFDQHTTEINSRLYCCAIHNSSYQFSQTKKNSLKNKQTNKQKLGESFLFEKIGHCDTKQQQQQQIERAN